jgi:hypothetical protein
VLEWFIVNIREHSRLQLEATKLGRNVVFQVTVFERKDRSKSRLYAETQCYDALQHMIQFVIRDAADIDSVIDMFARQLLHRGFVPVKYRLKSATGSWDAWVQVPDSLVPEGG